MEQLRIGLLGAASIAPHAVIKPARHVPGVAVTAVAARDAGRAQQYASRHGIPVVRGSYAALLDDPEVDAVYIGLPNGLHAEWTLRAMAAGKHVLCEKPFTSNAAQAAEVADAATEETPVVMEAMHYVYHPLADRLREIVAEELAPVREVEVTLSIPLPRFSDIRYDYDLAGGAMMDVGVYTVHVARLLAGEEPRVTSAEARTIGKDPRIDRAMTVRLAYPSGATGLLRASMWSRSLLAITARVTGERGTMKVTNYLAPQIFHRVRVETARGRRAETVRGEATYTGQLRAFEAAIRGGGAVRTTARDAVRTMTVIDDAYRAAGLPTR